MEDCMKKLCTSLREHATNVINFEKKKILSVTKKSFRNKKVTLSFDRMLHL